MRQETGPTTTAVTFEMPLFDGGKKLLPEAREVLAALSEGLAAEGEALIVEVVGHTDSAAVPPGRAFVDNPALALARAMIIAEALRRNMGLSEEIFLIRAGAARSGLGRTRIGSQIVEQIPGDSEGVSAELRRVVEMRVELPLRVVWGMANDEANGLGGS